MKDKGEYGISAKTERDGMTAVWLLFAFMLLILMILACGMWVF